MASENVNHAQLNVLFLFFVLEIFSQYNYGNGNFLFSCSVQ